VFRLLVIGGFLLGLAACERSTESTVVEVRLPGYLDGKQKIREGNYEAALEHFLQVIDSHDFTPESHLESGVILLEQLDDPISSIYHFKRYLEFKPDSREAPLVEELILRAKKQFAASLPANPFRNAVSRMELMETIQGLKKQIESMNQEIQELESRNVELESRLTGARETITRLFDEEGVEIASLSGEVFPGLSAQVDSETPPNATLERPTAIVPHPSDQGELPEHYQVKAGDSLYAISMKIYGDAQHIQSIYQANRHILKNVNDLKPGQVLKIPQ